MMNRSLWLHIVLFLLLPALAFGTQDAEDEFVSDLTQPKVDSILSLITTNTSDSIKLRCYDHVATISNSPDTVLKYARLALELCDESDLYHTSNAYDCISWAYYVKDEARLSLQYALKALPIIEKNGEEK